VTVHQAALLDPHTAATLTTEQIVAMVDDLLEGAWGAHPRAHPSSRLTSRHPDERRRGRR
jgi:alpha-galactosidase/6-phospho-beta-glucosidase family protein